MSRSWVTPEVRIDITVWTRYHYRQWCPNVWAPWATGDHSCVMLRLPALANSLSLVWLRLYAQTVNR